MIALHRNWNSLLIVSILNFERKKKREKERQKSKKNYRKLFQLRKVREKFLLKKIKEFLQGSKNIEKEIAVGVTYQSTTRYLFDDWITTTTTYHKKRLCSNPHGADISDCHSVSITEHTCLFFIFCPGNIAPYLLFEKHNLSLSFKRFFHINF